MENLESAIATTKRDLDTKRENEDDIGAEKAEKAMNGYLESYGDLISVLGEKAIGGTT